MPNPGPQTDIGKWILAEKYALPGETWRDCVNRVACALKDSDAHYHRFREVLLAMRFLPGGRILANAGADRARATMLNCFCSPAPLDSFDENGGIMDTLAWAGRTLRAGGGVGTDFSKLRPKGNPVRGLGAGATASGPCSFIDIWDTLGETIHAAGNRRGAQIATLDIDHPDALEFVRAKHTAGRWTNFNVSLWVPDEFMERAEGSELWETIMRSTFDHAEPGILFRSTIDRRNPLNYAERVSAPNPCGEIPLPENGSCLLGSFVLPKYVVEVDGKRVFDERWLTEDVEHIYPALDNVVDRTFYPFPAQQDEMQQKRRIGVGITGLANAGEALGYPYGSPEFCAFAQRVMRIIRNKLYIESGKRASEHGPFPMYDPVAHKQTEYFNSLPPSLQEWVGEYGLRNSHLTAIAPTGTMSLLADNVSSGLEPVFAVDVRRQILTPEGEIRMRLVDYGKRVFEVDPRQAHDCTVDDHLAVMEALAPVVCQSISKTVNVPHSIPWADFKQLYMRAWKGGLKSLSTFTTGGAREGILEAAEPKAPECQECGI